MKKQLLQIVFGLAIAGGISSPAFALRTIGLKDKSGGKGGSTPVMKGANCAPATARLFMQFNDVSALLENGGSMFQNRGGQASAGYEVPKGSNKYAIFSGSLWMGGTDVNGQLKLAALTFRTGNDFWPGPLTVNAGSGDYDPSVPAGDNVTRDFGEANIDPDQCLRYDQFYTIRKAEVIQFTKWWECDGNVTPQPAGCSEIEEPASEILNRIYNWPAHGDQSLGQDFYLAPFYDNSTPTTPANGIYDPVNDGDTPWYDDILGRDDIECGIDRRISLFGDETHWWVFNDKGNIHTETNGEPIGMEIRAQAFAFATNDEVNRMTFYNYELINRGTQTLANTYFSQFIDADLGNAQDDYAGCDVSRGLGYVYNGDNNDETNSGQQGYGANPPAIGVDFFEGPYQDADGIDNIGPYYQGDSLITPTVQDAINGDGIVYRGIGIGYGDTIIDNERFGMRRFTYFTNGAATAYSDPSTSAQFYNYMIGKWSFGEEMVYGGQGYAASTGATNIPADYMFPGESDPLNWSTAGVDPGFANGWDETTNDNPKGDRRFVQSAGPFTLRPGAVNNITVGIVYGRGSDGDLFSSVRAMATADTKAQALFDACFKILDPPAAPSLTIQELDRELILTLGNTVAIEDYAEEDKINITDPTVDRFYRFEGYQIFQMLDEDAGVADITDESKAILVAQCDLRNDVDEIINFEFDEDLGFSVPKRKVDGENNGIRHSFRITTDQFAQGDRQLVNHKTYYYIAVAYAFNQFKEYNPSDPTLLDGQKIPYIASRLGSDGSAISAVPGVPHNPSPENGGTVAASDYGSTPNITRIDGYGNGGLNIDLTAASENYILQNGFMEEPTYEKGRAPIGVRVIDPLNVIDGYFELEFRDYNVTALGGNAADTAEWTIYRYDHEGGQLIDSIRSDRQISVDNEQLIPDWGISVQIYQNKYEFPEGSGPLVDKSTDPIAATINFTDSSKQWLSFIEDNDAYFPTNWIRSGSNNPGTEECNTDLLYQNPCCYPDQLGADNEKLYARLLNGGVAPHRLVGYECDFMPMAYYNQASPGSSKNNASISFLPSVNVVLTNDKSKWTRCPVIELGRDANLNVGGAEPGEMRNSPSVNKNGQPDNSGTTGLGWFPGYAIDLESGARLYMAFGENSFLGSDGGADMIWNPSDRITDAAGNPIMGGVQPIYVYSYKLKTINGYSQSFDFDAYNETNHQLYNKMLEVESNSTTAKREVYSSLSWIFYPLLANGHSFGNPASNNFLETDVRIELRVNKEYKNFVATGENGGQPKYGWSTSDISTRTNSTEGLASALDLINVVPNPYYAYSGYERSRLDARVKITNLPDQCTVRIFNVGGKLVRTFKKDSPVTSVDWDLNNEKGIAVAGGVYLIHVDVPGVGTKIVKFFGGMRQIDLQGI